MSNADDPEISALKNSIREQIAKIELRQQGATSLE
jgi:hypothetical protein